MNNNLQVFLQLMNDAKLWIYGLIGGAIFVIVAIYGLKYLQGNDSEKENAMSNIKKTLYMGGGIFFLVALAIEVFNRFAAANGYTLPTP